MTIHQDIGELAKIKQELTSDATMRERLQGSHSSRLHLVQVKLAELKQKFKTKNEVRTVAKKTLAEIMQQLFNDEKKLTILNQNLHTKHKQSEDLAKTIALLSEKFHVENDKLNKSEYMLQLNVDFLQAENIKKDLAQFYSTIEPDPEEKDEDDDLPLLLPPVTTGQNSCDQTELTNKYYEADLPPRIGVAQRHTSHER